MGDDGAIVAYAASRGFEIPPDLAGLIETGVNAGLGAALGFVLAYFAPKNAET